MKEKFQRLRLETKSLKLSQSSATLGTCSLQEVAASWLRSHATNVHGASSTNCFPFSPTAICHFWPEVRCTHHVWGVWCCMQRRLGPWRWIHWTVSGVMTVPWSVGSAMSGQRTKLAQIPFSQSLASRTSRMRWFGHVGRSTGWIAEVRKLNVVAQKRSGRPRKSWDEVLENDRKKLGMDSADPQNRSEWKRAPSRKTCQKAQPSVEENRALKWIWWWWWWCLFLFEPNYSRKHDLQYTKVLLCENDWDTPINMADSCHLGVWNFIPVVMTPLIFLAIKFFLDVWMRWFYAWSRMKVYMINFYHHYSISGPTLVAAGILFRKQVFVSFIHFEGCQFSARKRIWSVKTFETHRLVRNSHQNYSIIVYFRSYQRISVSIGLSAKCR